MKNINKILDCPKKMAVIMISAGLLSFALGFARGVLQVWGA